MELGCTIQATDTNPELGDLRLSETGEEVVLTALSKEVAQRLFVRLQFFQGEWFLDLDAGTPYWQRILTKAGDRVIRAVFSEVILGTQGVSEIISLGFSIDRRRLSLVFKARLTDGTVFSSSDFGPFVVDA